MTDTAPKHSVVIEREMTHPPEKVWRALTQGPLIQEWLMANDFQPVVGHRFHFRSTPVPNWDGLIEGEVIEVEPNSRLTYSWATMGMKSLVAWTLTPANGGTHVRMEHSGFLSDSDAAYKGATYGWKNFIGKLEDVVGRLD
jgi:uncharacterized protein YndB with AHSA1/START domain